MTNHAPWVLLSGMPWFGWIAIVGIVSGAITKIAEMRMRHRERLEMIRQGMQPDGGKITQPEVY